MRVRKMDLGGGASQNYYIKNKDRVLGEFLWASEERVGHVEDYGLPEFVALSVDDWVGSRVPPKHRANMKRVLEMCGLKTTKGIIDYSHGLSLTDTLWITSDDSLKWSDVSLFRNEFDEVIAHTAFDGGLHGLPISTTSPEFGTDGILAKCWIREQDGGIYLVKAGTTGFANTGNEPYSEVMASQVLDRLGYSHVNYWLAKYRGRVVSKCRLFTDERRMLLPIHAYYSFGRFNELLQKCAADGVAEGLAQHLVLDYLTCNTDRHAGNLGVMLDADTFDLIGFAPVYDNGCSMLCYWGGAEDVEGYASQLSPAMYRTFEGGAVEGKRVLGHNHNVENLIGFRFDRSKLGGFPETRITAIEDWLQRRVESFLQL